MRRVPCWSCGRPTPLVELVETHVRAGPTTRLGWWVGADRVIWLCPSCAAPRRSSRPHSGERR
jgi:hypothetical protein